MNKFESDWINLSQSFVQNGLIEDGRIQDGRIQDGCHHQVESEWISLLSQSFVQNGSFQDGRIQGGRFQDGCHHQVNQIALVGVRVWVEGECFGVNLREVKKVSESKMAVSEFKMAEFKMAAIIKLSENEWLWVRLN